VAVRLELPTHFLYYENYTTDYDNTVESLFSFLELQPPPGRFGNFLDQSPFIPGKSYASYYSDHERILAGQVVKAMATPECWSLIRHYFPPAFAAM
jgi:hypothetical protein